jgi:hypothetical protein
MSTLAVTSDSERRGGSVSVTLQEGGALMYMEPVMSSASIFMLFMLLLCVGVIIALRDESRRASLRNIRQLVRRRRDDARGSKGGSYPNARPSR